MEQIQTDGKTNQWCLECSPKISQERFVGMPYYDNMPQKETTCGMNTNR